MAIDLHLHTTYSDGLRTPDETVDEAVKKNIKAIAITDHETTGGIEKAIIAAKNTSLEIIPGIEINSYLDNDEIHILGYYIDIQSGHLQNEIEYIRQTRITRARKIIKKLQNLNYNITFDELVDDGKINSVGRPHIARLLVKKGYFHNVKDVFNKLLTEGCPAFVDRYKISSLRAIEIIIKAGGIPVIAHPGIYKKEIDWKQMLGFGIMGIEAYHTKHDGKTTKKLLDIAQKYNLLVTGGSDCHGIGISSMMGILNLPYDIVLKLKEIKNN